MSYFVVESVLVVLYNIRRYQMWWYLERGEVDKISRGFVFSELLGVVGVGVGVPSVCLGGVNKWVFDSISNLVAALILKG